MSRGWLVAALGVWSCAACAQSIDAPALKAGDSWTVAETTEAGQQGYSRKEEVITVERVDSDDMLVSVKEDGSNQAPTEKMVGRDWSRSRDINGKQETINRPLAFPLRDGKKWTVDYTELNPNRMHTRETFHSEYVVTGWEDVQVPAGTFKALKIEAQGQWTADLAPAIIHGSGAAVTPGDVSMASQSVRITPHTISGRLYKAFWYVPEQKRFVKSVEEYYSTKGVRSQRFTEELTASKLAG